MAATVQHRHKGALLGAAITVAALGIGTSIPTAPDAGAIAFDTVTAGPLFWLVDALGYRTYTIDVPVIGSITLNLDNANSTPTAVNSAINAVPFSDLDIYLGTRNPLVLSESSGAYAAAMAYQALISSAQGNTVPGYSALTPGTVDIPNQTNQALALIWNPTRPNGGLYARFGPLLGIFGPTPVLPEAGVPAGQVAGIKLNTATLDFTQAYSSVADFPAVPNPFSLVNSLLSTLLPTYLLDGGTFMGSSLTSAALNIVEVLAGGQIAPDGKAFYSTFLPSDLPLLEPLRLPIRIINLVSQLLEHPLNLPTPIADALEPAFRILVNIGYTDVVTPTEGGTYNRTFDQSATYTPFMSQSPLTLQEWLQVPLDVAAALVNGIVTEIHELFGGTAAPATPAAATTATSTTAKDPAAVTEPEPDPKPAIAVPDAAEGSTLTGPSAKIRTVPTRTRPTAAPESSPLRRLDSANADTSPRGLGSAKRNRTGSAAATSEPAA